MDNESVIKQVIQTMWSQLAAPKCIDGTECLNCEYCIVRNTAGTKAIIDAGAERVSSALGAVTNNTDIARLVDHTLLKPDATEQEIRKLCEEAMKYKFAAVCVNPYWVPLARKLITDPKINVCTVVGFPLGANKTVVKAFEAEAVKKDGANEFDMVINIGALKSKDYKTVFEDIKAVVEAVAPDTVKVIIETALLTDEEKVEASAIAREAGAHFVKTSTGFAKGGATVHDIELIRRVVGETMGVKASCGIKDYQTAAKMLAAGATRIGASAGVRIVESKPE